MAANLEGEGKTSVEDFNAILGSTAYAKPRVNENAMKMLVVVSKTAVKLAGNQPWIASMGYTHAVALMSEQDRPIAEYMEHMIVFHMIDREVHLAFRAIYKQVYKAQTTAFSINRSIIATLYAKIDTIFNQIVRNQVSDFHLPVELENYSAEEILKHGEEIPVDSKKKQQRDGKNTSTQTKNYKQKGGCLTCGAYQKKPRMTCSLAITPVEEHW